MSYVEKMAARKKKIRKKKRLFIALQSNPFFFFFGCGRQAFVVEAQLHRQTFDSESKTKPKCYMSGRELNLPFPQLLRDISLYAALTAHVYSASNHTRMGGGGGSASQLLG